MSVSLVTVSYIGATILFILSLGGLSNPETAKRGNWYGIIGMAIAVLATMFGYRSLMSGDQPIVTGYGYAYIVVAMVDRRRDRALGRAHRQDDPDAGAGGDHALAGRLRRLHRRLRQLHRHLDGVSDRRRARDPRARNLHRRADRRGDVLRFGDRVRQAVGEDQRQAGAAAGAPLAQPRSACSS